MRTDSAPTISRHDYLPYPYSLPRVEFTFDLDPAQTRVHAHMEFERISEQAQPLVLNGQDLELVSVLLDGHALSVAQYRLENGSLTLFPAEQRFTLEIISACR